MRIALAQINFTVGDLNGNADRMVAAIEKAEIESVDLIVFSELSICGYIPKDMLNYKSFVERCDKAVERVAQHCTKVAAIVGAPVSSNLEKGKHLFNAAHLLENGKITRTIHKTLLPTYDIFDEYRYFEPGKNETLVEFKGVKIALTVCEDLWNLDKPHLYPNNPMDTLSGLKPDIMVNISGSPYSYNHVDDRKTRMKDNASHYGLPLVYVNQVGANTDILFDGGSMFINSDGTVAVELNYFEEDLQIVDWEAGKNLNVHEQKYHDRDVELIHDAIVMGIRDYFSKMGFKKAILGSSGGIDSALVNALAVEALGKENVHSVLMPSIFSSQHSVDDAIQLSENLGNPYTILPIKEMVAAVESTLSEPFEGRDRDVTEENIQARSRGLLLMAMSNKFGAMLLNTSNKSESAVGYTTLYGDMCGGLSVIGDLYKTQVYYMSRYINRNGELIPENILTKAPSAELRPGQKDSDSLPEYEILDDILMYYIENQLGWQEIVELGFDEEVVRKVVQLIDRNEYKRYQAAPTLRISYKAFGPGRQMPLVAKYFH